MADKPVNMNLEETFQEMCVETLDGQLWQMNNFGRICMPECHFVIPTTNCDIVTISQGVNSDHFLCHYVHNDDRGEFYIKMLLKNDRKLHCRAVNKTESLPKEESNFNVSDLTWLVARLRSIIDF